MNTHWTLFTDTSAEKLLGSFPQYCLGPVDVDGVCRAMGIAVYRVPLDVAGATRTTPEGHGQIWVRESDSSPRQRVSVAKGLAYILYHPRGEYRFTEFHTSGKPEQAAQTEDFAERLLLPISLVAPWWRYRSTFTCFDGNQLASDFEVTAVMVDSFKKKHYPGL